MPSGVYQTVCLGQPTAEQKKQLDPKHEVLQYDDGPCDKPEQTGATAFGLHTEDPHVCASCNCNKGGCIYLRHGKKQAEREPWDAPLWRGPETIARSLGEAMAPEYISYDVEYIIDGKWWSTEKWSQAKLDAILASCEIDRVSPNIIKAHMKREIGAKYPKKGRGIQAYVNLATQSHFGSTFYALQKAASAVMKRWTCPGKDGEASDVKITMASGMSPQQIADLLTEVERDYKRPSYGESDGKDWDSSCDICNFNLAGACYCAALGKDSPQAASFEEFRAKGFDILGIFSGSKKRRAVIYKLKGTVKSGHNDTTLGNSINNAILAASVFIELGLKCDILVAGDDLIYIVEGAFDNDTYENGIRRYGIKPEGRVFDRLVDCSFISLSFWKRPDGSYVATPAPGKVLSKFLCTTKPPSKKKKKDFIHSICVGTKYCFGDMPVVRTFVDACDTDGQLMTELINGEEVIRVNRKVFSKNKGLEGLDFTDQFCDRYQITRLELEALENCLAASFAGLARVNGCVTPHRVIHPILRRMRAVDTADPITRKVFFDTGYIPH